MLIKLDLANLVYLQPATCYLLQVVFTNGGMSIRDANLRLSQHLLISSFGERFNALAQRLDKNNLFTRLQLKSVFSSMVNVARAYSAAGKLREHQLDMLIELLRFRGGNLLLWKTIRYLNDRYACEERWMAALSRLRHLHVHFLWGTFDAVAPVVIPKNVLQRIDREVTQPGNATDAEALLRAKKGQWRRTFLVAEAVAPSNLSRCGAACAADIEQNGAARSAAAGTAEGGGSTEEAAAVADPAAVVAETTRGTESEIEADATVTTSLQLLWGKGHFWMLEGGAEGGVEWAHRIAAATFPDRHPEWDRFRNEAPFNFKFPFATSRPK